VTPEDVREFQRAHVDVFGKALVQDGDLGPSTQWALDLFSCSPRRRAVVHRAQSALGVTEEPPGSNRGPRIDEWLQRCHVSTGLPWCAAFASWCLETVAIAGAQALGKHFLATDVPLPGDVMYFLTGGGKGHCGIVVGIGEHEVMTIEGNCQDAVRVARRARDRVRFSSTGDDLRGICPLSIARAPFLATTIKGTR
jgi:uncharacterized protein (TIGR02594 family)